jgi:predicted Fe-Mo cluster-binding NifX family protein
MEKIAFPTEDGKTIHQHFGRAPYFTVATIQDNGTVQYEQRSKAFHGQEPAPAMHGTGHGHGPMLAPISDCQVLIAGGMGQPAYQSASQAGLKVIMTGEKSIEAALQAYQAGRLASDEGRVHAHGANHTH